MHIKLNPFDMLQYRIIEGLRNEGLMDDAELWATMWLLRPSQLDRPKEAVVRALAALGIEM